MVGAGGAAQGTVRLSRRVERSPSIELVVEFSNCPLRGWVVLPFGTMEPSHGPIQKRRRQLQESIQRVAMSRGRSTLAGWPGEESLQYPFNGGAGSTGGVGEAQKPGVRTDGKCGEQTVADQVAVHCEVAIGGVLGGSKTHFSQRILEMSPADGEKGPEYVILRRPHGRESCDSRTEQHAEAHRFDLIVCMMGGEDSRGTSRFGDAT
jgi:hypothetical protein